MTRIEVPNITKEAQNLKNKGIPIKTCSEFDKKKDLYYFGRV